ncbi:hypothetical protein D3C80_1825450 [compost metagenome]
MLAHQVRIGLLDVHLDLDGALVFGELVTLHLADLDLPVIDRATLFQRTQALGLEHQVQARQGVR